MAEVLYIQISDTGKGFRDINSKDVFHKFSRTKNPKTSGSGLGLSIVKGFSDALGGHVSLENSGHGAIFHISIPVKTNNLKFMEN